MTGPQPHIRRNDFRTLEVPTVARVEDGAELSWRPHLSVTVVVPGFNNQPYLDLLLAALTEQTYPADLIDVVVVDDGSEPAITVPELAPERTQLVSVAEGWGPGAARRRGAEVAEGDVLLWLDADVIPFPEHLEAQLRWHHAIDYAVVLGEKHFSPEEPLLELGPSGIAKAARTGGMPGLVQAPQPHAWVAEFWERTGLLADAGTKAFRVHVGATASVRRDLYRQVLGWRPEVRLGEDVDLGWQLAQAGAVFIAEPEARSWHIGLPRATRDGERVQRYQEPFLANLTAGFRPKRRRRGRIYEVPFVDVILKVTGHDAAAVTHWADALLDSSIGDLRLTLVGPFARIRTDRRALLDDPDADLCIIQRAFQAEPRVRLVDALPAQGLPDDLVPPAWWLEWPDPSAVTSRKTLEAWIAHAERTQVGRLQIPLPNGSGVAVMTRHAALARARHLAPGEGEQRLAEVLAQTYGVLELTAEESGVVVAEERALPRFQMPPQPAADPAESRAAMRRFLGTQHKPAHQPPVSEASPAPEPKPTRASWWRGRR